MRSFLAAACLAFAAFGAAAAALDPPGARLITSESGRFRFEAPDDWEKAREPGGDGVESVLLLGPGEDSEPAPFLTVEFYPSGRQPFRSADVYLRAQTKFSETAAAALAGRPARRWRRLENSLDRRGRDLTLQSEGVVLSVADGFYALTLTAPQARFRGLRRVFQRAVDTFAPAPR